MFNTNEMSDVNEIRQKQLAVNFIKKKEGIENGGFHIYYCDHDLNQEHHNKYHK